MRTTIIRTTIGLTFAAVLLAGAVAAAAGPKAVFPQMRYEFEPVMEGEKIVHDFVVENQGDAPLVIKNIRPD